MGSPEPKEHRSLDVAKSVCGKAETYPPLSIVGQVVKTPAFHAGITGSIPVRCIDFFIDVHELKFDDQKGKSMYEMLLDDLLDKLEQNGIDTSKIKISEESDENSGLVV